MLFTITEPSECHIVRVTGICPSIHIFSRDAVACWLRHYATSRKVAGSSPDEVDFFLNLPNPSSLTMTLASTQPLTEMSTWNLPGA
jgi:hypothetical protein